MYRGFTLGRSPTKVLHLKPFNFNYTFRTGATNGSVTGTLVDVAISPTTGTFTGNVSGTHNGSALTLNYVYDAGFTATFIGTINGSTITGRVTGICGNGASVTFTKQVQACSDLVNPPTGNGLYAVQPHIAADAGRNCSTCAMVAYFTPNFGLSLDQAASVCGFAGFNWQQTVTVDPLPIPISACYTASLLCPSTKANPGIPVIAPFSDPPISGWLYDKKGDFDFAYPFYLDPFVAERYGLYSTYTLGFSDTPAIPVLNTNIQQEYGFKPSADSVKFFTSLVGVLPGNQPSFPPLYSWTWKSNFNGTSGSASTTANFNPVDPGSGTGGITITGINGVPQEPPIVSCSATPNTLWPPNGKAILVTLSGTISAGTSVVISQGYRVTDEYGQVQPSGNIASGPGGTYSTGVSLIAARDGTDLDGRVYTINVIATDSIGNVGSCSAVVTVPHDQGH